MCTRDFEVGGSTEGEEIKSMKRIEHCQPVSTACQEQSSWEG